MKSNTHIVRHCTQETDRNDSLARVLASTLRAAKLYKLKIQKIGRYLFIERNSKLKVAIGNVS